MRTVLSWEWLSFKLSEYSEYSHNSSNSIWEWFSLTVDNDSQVIPAIDREQFSIENDSHLQKKLELNWEFLSVENFPQMRMTII